MLDDQLLLQRYTRDREEDAFTALVRRHIDGVYSTALRRVGGDAHLAEDVTQEVFASLARHAPRLVNHPVLTGWLFLTARRAAANVVRRERRRKARELTSATMQDSNSAEEPIPDWSRLGPVIDEALDRLNYADRSTILLRFVDHLGFAEIGRALRVTEDAARMRHDRALDKLRSELSRRGLTSTSAALGVALAHHIVVAAPALTAAKIISATGFAGAALSFSPFSFVSLMSTTKASLTLVGLAVLAGTATVAYRLGSHQLGTSTTLAAKSSNNLPTTARSSSAGGNFSLSTPKGPAGEAAPVLSPSAQKIVELKELLARFPEQNIPELSLATEADWYAAVDSDLTTPEDYRRALAQLRGSAIRRFGGILQPVLKAYADAHAGQFPQLTSELQPLMDPKLDPAMLARYRVAPAAEIPNVKMGGSWMLTNTIIDPDYDDRFVIGPNGRGSASPPLSPERESASYNQVLKAYLAAGGSPPVTASDYMKLAPYVKTGDQGTALQRAVQRAPKNTP